MVAASMGWWGMTVRAVGELERKRRRKRRGRSIRARSSSCVGGWLAGGAGEHEGEMEGRGLAGVGLTRG